MMAVPLSTLFTLKAPLVFYLDGSVEMQGDRTNNYVDSLRNTCGQREFNMIMCVMRAPRLDTYSAIKKLTVSDYGIPSQVLFKSIFIRY